MRKHVNTDYRLSKIFDYCITFQQFTETKKSSINFKQRKWFNIKGMYYVFKFFQ